MRHSWLKLYLHILTLGPLCICSTAQAFTLAAPLGGSTIVLPSRHVVCDSNADLGGWRIDVTGARTRVRPPPVGTAVGQVVVKTATTQAACRQTTQAITLTSVVGWPGVQTNSVVVNVDVGRIDMQGSHLKDVVLRWQVGPRTGEDICTDPPFHNGMQSCAFSVERGLSADPSEMRLTVLPQGLHPDEDLLAFDADGRKLAPQKFTVTPAKIVLVDLISIEATLDAAVDPGRISLRHPEAIDHISCRGATCELDGRDLVVRGVRALEEGLEVRPTLRPHVFLQGATQLLSAPVLTVPLQHCPIQVISAAPLRGISGQQLVVSVGGRCREDVGLRYFVGGSPAQVRTSFKEGDKLYTVLHTDASLGEDVTVVLQRQNSVAGMARVMTRVVPSARTQVNLPGYGFIDFIPSNRSAEVLLPTLSDGGELVPIAVPGVYTVTGGGSGNGNSVNDGAFRIQGIQGATGWVALRLAYRDASLPASLKDTHLAELTDSVDRSIHPASIPLTLGKNALGDSPIIELECTDTKGTAHRIGPAHPTSISYQQKDSCRLVLHRERLAPENGDQLVRVTVNVAALDGTNRPEAAIDQRVLMRPGHEARYLYLGGVAAPFDRMVVRVAVITEDLHESVAAIGQGERVNLAQVQWSLTVGNNHVRLYATTAMPTGLFRVADKGHSGLMGLNAGILSRLVLLTRAGVQAPIALELGVMVLGIAGDQVPAPGGHVAAVMGLSLSVPIANVSRTTQAAISLHAWGEYEVSRVFIARAGTPWGFVFGPSLSFGDVGVNL